MKTDLSSKGTDSASFRDEASAPLNVQSPNTSKAPENSIKLRKFHKNKYGLNAKHADIKLRLIGLKWPKLQKLPTKPGYK